MQEYDPSAVKLFSKCARDHASRNKAKKSDKAYSRANQSSTNIVQQTKNDKKLVSTFEMVESREQREKKFKSTITPAVGQYNSKYQFQRPKLTWDILKAYQKRGCSVRPAPRDSAPTTNNNKYKDPGTAGEIQNTLNLNQSQIQTEFSATLSPNKNIDNAHPAKAKTQEKQAFNNNDSRVYSTIRSQVDMAKMVGRKQQHNNRYVTKTEIDLDLSRSIDFIKTSSIKKFSFQQQVSREKANDALGKKIFIAADYSYDYKKVKPKKTAYISFAKCVGRRASQKSGTSVDTPYSYTHYDYESYVWNGKSNIFSNTKTHMIDFKKQTNRRK